MPSVEDMVNEFNDIFAHNIRITDEMISTFQTHIQSMDSQEFDFNFFYKYLLMKTNSTNNTNIREICLSQTTPTVNPNIPEIPVDENPTLNTGHSQRDKDLTQTAPTPIAHIPELTVEEIESFLEPVMSP